MSEGKLVPFLPLQDATGTVARRRPGRPRSIEKKPTADDLLYFAEIAEQRIKFLEDDPVVRSVENKTEGKQTIHEIRVNLAREAADLAFQKLELSKRGRDVAQLSSRRAEILVRLASMELEAMRVDASTLDPRSEVMQKIFGLWVEDLRTVVAEVLSEPQANAFFTTLAARMEDWETRVEEILR